MSRHVAGTVLAARCKGAVTWQARIATDRGRLEVVGIVPASVSPTVIEPLDERELRELLGEGTELHDDREDRPDAIQRIATVTPRLEATR